MKHLGIEVSVQNLPELDPNYIPLFPFYQSFLKDAEKPLDIAVERAGGQVAVYHTKIHGTPDMAEADRYYVERIIKTMLWLYGGFKVYISGDDAICDDMRKFYCAGGQQEFDWDYMANVFEHPFEIVSCDAVPAEKGDPKAIGRHLEGCRIGFDAGGSDRKVSAVIDGEPVFSEEVHRGCPQVRRRPYAPGGRGGRVLRRRVHQQPHHERLPVPEGAQGSL